MAKIKTLLRFALFALIFLAVLSGLYVSSIYCEVSIKKILPYGQSDEIVVKPGTSLRGFAKQVEARGYVSGARLFTVAYLSQYPSKTMQAGAYQVTDQDTILDLVNKIGKGKSKLESFTIIEGQSWRAIKKNMHMSNSFITHREVDLLNRFKERGFTKFYQQELHSLEGLLMPNTYLFKRGIHDYKIIEEAMVMQTEYLKNKWQQRDYKTPYQNPYEALIVASLIEKESHYIAEYPKIAAVIINRIRSSMPIQIDAAVIYGLGGHKKKVLYRDLKKDTPYNTYRKKGLPPTPIGMPSKSAIDAALHPYEFAALFYVIDSNDKSRHIFTNDYKSHLAAKNAVYQKP